MRIKLGRDTQHHGSRSYLDSADDIMALPMRELQRISRATERASKPEDWPIDGLHELDRIYGLASQI
jgi:hypothetical protein